MTPMPDPYLITTGTMADQNGQMDALWDCSGPYKVLAAIRWRPHKKPYRVVGMRMSDAQAAMVFASVEAAK